MCARSEVWGANSAYSNTKKPATKWARANELNIALLKSLGVNPSRVHHLFDIQ